MTIIQLREKRGALLRDAGALKSADGSFKDDQARAAFDAKMTEIDTVDDQIRTAEIEERGQSQFLTERTPAAAADDQRQAADDAEPNERDLGAKAERARVQGITLAVRAARLPTKIADKLIADGVALVDAQRQIFEELQRQTDAERGPNPSSRGRTNIDSVGPDPLTHERKGIEGAILHRIAPKTFPLGEEARLYRGMTMLDIAQTFLKARGVRTTDMSRLELAGVALGLTGRGGMHTTSDFAELLANVINKTLRAEYAEQPQTFAPIARTVTVRDFKTVNRVQLGDAPALKQVAEHGEFTRGTISEGKESYAIGTWGKIFAITRQALINDDLDAFSRVPRMFGRSVRTLESNLVWAEITDNGNMSDGDALFSSDHSNIDSAGAVISIQSLSDGRSALRLQRGLDGSRINLSARSLIVPTTLETKAEQFTSQIQPNQSAVVNPFAGKLIVIAEPRLDDDSIVSWYLAASLDQIDMVELAYLEGQEGPSIEQRLGFDVDGLEIKCRHDVAAKVIEYRGLYKNVGDEEPT